MKITLKDNRPGFFGSIHHSPEFEPIRLELTKEDRANIAAMPEEKTTLFIYPDHLTREEAKAVLESTVKNPAPPGLDAARCLQVLEAIDCGSLDSARAMLLEAIPKA